MPRKVKNHVKVYTSSFFAEVHVSKEYRIKVHSNMKMVIFDLDRQKCRIKVHIHVKMTTFVEEHLVE